MCGVKGRRFIVLFKYSLFRRFFKNVCVITELANKAYFNDIAVANISHSFTHKMAAKDSWHRNYVTLILCITWYDGSTV